MGRTRPACREAARSRTGAAVGGSGPVSGSGERMRQRLAVHGGVEAVAVVAWLNVDVDGNAERLRPTVGRLVRQAEQETGERLRLRRRKAPERGFVRRRLDRCCVGSRSRGRLALG